MFAIRRCPLWGGVRSGVVPALEWCPLWGGVRSGVVSSGVVSSLRWCPLCGSVRSAVVSALGRCSLWGGVCSVCHALIITLLTGNLRTTIEDSFHNEGKNLAKDFSTGGTTYSIVMRRAIYDISSQLCKFIPGNRKAFFIFIKQCPSRYCQSCEEKGHDSWDKKCIKYS